LNAAPDLMAAPVLRPAGLADVEAMAAMINRFAARELMLPKSSAELYRAFREYVVLTGPAGEVVACAGLRIYSPELAEIIGLAVHEGWQRRGLGPRLVAHLIEEGRRIGVRRVFAMALRPAFFEALGFRTIQREWLPEKIAGDCRACDRRAGCVEVALITELDAEAAPLGPPAPTRARRARGRVVPLRVLPAAASVSRARAKRRKR
jgi:amino-acid N-acetyltransferase